MQGESPSRKRRKTAVLSPNSLDLLHSVATASMNAAEQRPSEAATEVTSGAAEVATEAGARHAEGSAGAPRGSAGAPLPPGEVSMMSPDAAQFGTINPNNRGITQIAWTASGLLVCDTAEGLHVLFDCPFPARIMPNPKIKKEIHDLHTQSVRQAYAYAVKCAEQAEAAALCVESVAREIEVETKRQVDTEEARALQTEIINTMMQKLLIVLEVSRIAAAVSADASKKIAVKRSPEGGRAVRCCITSKCLFVVMYCQSFLRCVKQEGVQDIFLPNSATPSSLVALCKWLFVLGGDTIFKFEVASLQLVGKVTVEGSNLITLKGLDGRLFLLESTGGGGGGGRGAVVRVLDLEFGIVKTIDVQAAGHGVVDLTVTRTAVFIASQDGITVFSMESGEPVCRKPLPGIELLAARDKCLIITTREGMFQMQFKTTGPFDWALL